MQSAHPVTCSISILSWFTLFRLGATARGILPFILGGVIAWSEGYAINWMVLVLSTIAVTCVMLMTFLINEYYDYEGDVINKEFHKLSGGSRMLPLGLLRRRHSLIAAYIFLFLAIVIGPVIQFVFQTGAWTIPLGAIAIFIGYFYTVSPVKLSYRGFGEIAIWFACGWLANMTGYYLQSGHFSTVTTLISFPGATSVFLVILMNEIPDINADRQVGKRNLVVRLGKEKSAVLYKALLVLCFLNIIAIIPFGVPPLSAALSVILLPLIATIILTIKRQGLNNTTVQENLSLKTMLVDHLITIIYSIAFLSYGFASGAITLAQMGLIALVYIIVFSLEGVSILSSKIVLFQELSPRESKLYVCR